MSLRERVRACIGLGSNLGDRRAHLRTAVEALRRLPETELLAVSSLYRTRPHGPQNQPEYLNAVALVETVLAPEALLRHLQAIERAAGRRRDGRRWGPRTLDLDLLVHGGARRAGAALTLPHPRLAERAFVLEPLAEVAPDLEIPGLGPVARLRAACADDSVLGREAAW